MTARWPDPDRAIIGRHVASLDLHSMKSRTCYRQVLHGFQDVAERYEALDQEVLLAWLRESAIRRAASTLLHRTRIIDRFLERLVEIGAIQRNPVVALRDECNIKQCMPIWRALGSRDPEQALAELRQPRPFGSVLGEMMADHVAMMRRRGYKYTSQPLLLLRFDRFLQLHPGPEAEPLNAMIDRWAATNVTRHHAEECEKLKRVFAKILRHRDPSTPVRRPDPRPRKEAAKQWRKPHIYSPADVRRMLEVARSYPSPRAPLRPRSMYTMLLLAYCAGLRRGELARLDLSDVDLKDGMITIRQTKFFKTRILPLPDSVVVGLRAYIDERQRSGGSQDARSGLFWHDRGDGHYTPEMITWLLADVTRPCRRAARDAARLSSGRASRIDCRGQKIGVQLSYFKKYAIAAPITATTIKHPHQGTGFEKRSPIGSRSSQNASAAATSSGSVDSALGGSPTAVRERVNRAISPATSVAASKGVMMTPEPSAVIE